MAGGGGVLPSEGIDGWCCLWRSWRMLPLHVGLVWVIVTGVKGWSIANWVALLGNERTVLYRALLEAESHKINYNEQSTVILHRWVVQMVGWLEV